MKVVITIGRQFACGARNIGKMLADKLQIKYYDKELLNMAAKDMNQEEIDFAKYDERSAMSFSSLYNATRQLGAYYAGITNYYLINDDLFFRQSEIIREISKDSCVIVGRCADHILSDREDVLKLFFYAPNDYRISIFKKYNPSEDSDKHINKTLTKIDKRRSSYYEMYTDKKFGDVSNYNLCFDTSKISDEGIVETIASYIKALGKS